MAENAELPTLILDEIDTGVSGRIADEMGNVMQEMSTTHILIEFS
jgi:DNA repair protein RecN (Recombination protein N)